MRVNGAPRLVGEYFAAGVGAAAITGPWCGSMLIIDDPHSEQDASKRDGI